jgi:hypothetical protein
MHVVPAAVPNLAFRAPWLASCQAEPRNCVEGNRFKVQAEVVTAFLDVGGSSAGNMSRHVIGTPDAMRVQSANLVAVSVISTGVPTCRVYSRPEHQQSAPGKQAACAEYTTLTLYFPASAMDYGTPNASYNYVVTAHKPTGITHAIVGQFTSPDDVNLITAYGVECACTFNHEMLTVLVLVGQVHALKSTLSRQKAFRLSCCRTTDLVLSWC